MKNKKSAMVQESDAFLCHCAQGPAVFCGGPLVVVRGLCVTGKKAEISSIGDMEIAYMETMMKLGGRTLQTGKISV